MAIILLSSRKKLHLLIGFVRKSTTFSWVLTFGKMTSPFFIISHKNYIEHQHDQYKYGAWSYWPNI